MIWKQRFTIKDLNEGSANTMVTHLGIEFTEAGEDYLCARMPVDERTVQPARVLHGGASASLAETVGSVAANLCIADLGKQACVGAELNVSHLRPATSGYVYATARPLKVGRKLQSWSIHIKDEAGKLVSVSRLTMATIEKG